MQLNSRYRWALLSLFIAAAPALADGPGAYRPPPKAAAAPVISELDAINAYNSGYALIQRADHAISLATATTHPNEREASSQRALELYRESLPHFEKAVALDPSMHEALTYLGYANRRLGQHTVALDAYARALQIYPDYPNAIEYQGEAYLGLNRINEARFNYLRLYALDKGQAKKLLKAMSTWVATQPASDFSTWVAQRLEVTKNDPETAW